MLEERGTRKEGGGSRNKEMENEYDNAWWPELIPCLPRDLRIGQIPNRNGSHIRLDECQLRYLTLCICGWRKSNNNMTSNEVSILFYCPILRFSGHFLTWCVSGLENVFPSGYAFALISDAAPTRPIFRCSSSFWCAASAFNFHIFLFKEPWGILEETVGTTKTHLALW